MTQRPGAIRWINSDKGASPNSIMNNVTMRRNAAGKLVVHQKLPSHAHVDDETAGEKAPIHPDARAWYRIVGDHNGHIIAACETSGSAAIKPSDLDCGQARAMRAKARYFGWMPIDRCPNREVNGAHAYVPTLRASTIVDKSILEGAPCKSIPEDGCRHFKAELAARRKAYEAGQAEREAAMDHSREEKQERKLQSEAIATLLAQNRELMAELVRLKQGSAPAKTEEPRKGRKG